MLDFDLDTPPRAQTPRGGVTGLEELKAGAERVQVDDKRVINCQADVNQLVPFKYQWAWQKYLDACASHWMPQEINMSRDIATWKDPQGLSADERAIIKHGLGFCVTEDSLAANNAVLAMYRHVTNPECRQYLLRQAFEEALHMHAYRHIAESLGLDQGEIFTMYREVPCIRDKDAFQLQFTRDLMDSDFATGTEEDDRRFLRDLIGYYVLMEGIFFYVGLVQMLSFGRHNKMAGLSEQFRYILRDKWMHLNFGIDLINQVRIENPSLWSEAFQKEIIGLIKEAAALEYRYAVDTMPREVLGLNAAMFDDYIKFIANRRCQQIGLPAQYPGASNPFPWMGEALDQKKENHFFDTRATEHQTGGALSWD
ncbi:MAG TPA: ribonucleotide-diphosphate reductase subunit beta [Acidiferrobacter sp.]|nr:ribonucleotide-diphosphate reductase subunit beta [Acidiferrobacter sp.]